MQLSAEQQKMVEEQKQHCPFCKIIKGEIPSQKVYEDSFAIAVLDINPAVPGHTILIPKEHYPILPLMPIELQQHLGWLVGQLGNALRKAMLAQRTESFIANGAAAGQQSSHFLIHMLPTEHVQFGLHSGESEQAKQLEAILKSRFGNKHEQLIKTISQYPELRKILVEQPEELIKNLPSAPDLQRLFQGVDIMKLSEALRKEDATKIVPTTQDNAIALQMSDEQLVAFINNKEKLKDYLLNNHEQLQQALEDQPKLKLFFSGTTVAEVRQRYLEHV